MNKALLLMDLEVINKAFKKVGAEMFLLYGTALGAYRDGDFLPGDDDLDIGSFDIHLRDKVAEELRKQGFEIATCWDENINGYRESEMIHGWHDVHFDIFFFREQKEGFMANRAVEEEPFVLLPPETTKDLEDVSLCGRTYKILSPPEKYLEFCYQDWKDPTKKDHGKLYHDLLGKKFDYTLFKP